MTDIESNYSALPKPISSNSNNENTLKNKTINNLNILKKNTRLSNRFKWTDNLIPLKNDRSCSPITKRLRSLVIPNSQTISNDNVKNEITNNTNAINLLKSNSMSQLNQPIKTLNHSRLRGFLKQINEEKSGFMTNNINFSDKNRKYRCKTQEIPYSNLDIITNDDNDTERNEKYKVNELTYENYENNSDKTELDVTKINFADDSIDNVNVSNCNGMLPSKYINNRDSKYSPGSSSNSQDDNTSQQIKTHELYQKLSHRPSSKFNSIINKITKYRDKQKFHNCAKNEHKLTNLNKNQTLSITSPIMATGDYGIINKSKNELNDENNLNTPQLLLNENWDHQDETPQNNGDYDKKTKLKLSKKFFKIFSQSSSYPKESKKTKLIITCLESVSKISFDSLINLITILSVELIINSIKNAKKAQMKSIKKSKRKDINKKSQIMNKNDKIHSDLNCINKSNLSTVSSMSNIKKCNLTFDLNGRVILNDGNRSINLRNRLSSSHIDSINSLSGSSNRIQSSLRAKHASTLSIPSGYDINHNYNTGKHLNSYSRFGERNRISYSRIDSRKSSQNSIKFNDQSSIDNTQSFSKKLNSNSILHRPYSTSLTEIKQRQSTIINSTIHNRYEITKSGTYKCTMPLKTKLDPEKLDEVFLLKDTLYTKCNNTTLYIRPNKQINNLKMFDSNIDNNSKSDDWILYIESPSLTVLNNSLKIVAKKFPNWNIVSKNLSGH